jgi:branched-chain amino acid transport system substrate-binding protein
MKMEALTTWMKDQKDIKKVYILGQNYSAGVQFTKYAKEGLKLKRPDVQIVGDDLHPLAQVRDFAPYISKIKQSGADTVMTGNWGSDLSLLLKAANEAGLQGVRFLTFYAYGSGTPTAMGSTSEGKVFNVAYAHYNMGGDIQKTMDAFKAKINEDLYQPSIHHVFSLLDAAFVAAKSTDPIKVAAALEGMKLKSFNGEIEMRKSDHQLQQSLYITRWEKKSAKYPYDAENTGYTLAPLAKYEPYVASTPTSCQMKRP